MSVAVWPNGSESRPTISRVYGFKSSIYSGGIHKGVDTVGHTYNCSPEAGTVISARYNGQQGNEILIRGDSGKIHRLSHNKSFIRTGGRVAKGERVGVTGATGLATGVHCHWEVRTGSADGAYQDPGAWLTAVNAAPAGGTANTGAGQRKVLPSSGTVTRRAGPSTQSAILQPALQPNEVGNFDGWIYGENVNGNSVWYRGISGAWFWSGGFVGGADGTGLTNLNPPPVVSADLSKGQRTAGPDGVRRRSEPRSSSAETGALLAPGTVGNFTGWIRGENVSGNDVWYKGTSGDWFWSGGFVEGANGTGLTDLNPPASTLKPTQRKVLSTAPANRRAQPSSQSAITGNALVPDQIGDFKGWTHGEAVNGNDVWYQGDPSGDWFWSGGFVGGANTSGLPEIDLSPTTPTPPDEPEVPPITPGLTGTQRQVLPDASVNGRSGPGVSYALTGTPLPANEIGNFNGWAEGDSVSGNNVWFRGTSGRWFWSGGFVDKGTHDLEKVTYLPPADETRTPIYPGATKAYNTPAGGPREPASATIDKLYVHHTATTSDQVAYFKTINDRKSCPTFYVKSDGSVIEFIRPKLRPWSTGQPDHYALAIETQNTSGSPTWGISDESHEAIAQIAAWMGQQTEIDGVPVTFTIDRQHILGHNEAPGSATACPGPSMDLARITARALEILGTSEPEPVPSKEIPESLRTAWIAFKNEMDEYLS